MIFKKTLAWAFAAALSAGAHAQDYPTKPVRIVVPFPPGGSTDIITRIIGQRLSEDWKQPVVVDNRPGAGANIGAENAVKSPADGYTLLMASTIHSINPSLYPKLSYDPLKDFTPIIMVAETAQVLVVHLSVQASNISEFVALLKSQPGKLTYSSAGNGSQPHLAAELFGMMTATRMLHIPYKGGPPAMTDLVAGHVLASFATAPSAVPNVKGGKIKALGVSTKGRVPALPDVPTIAESGVPGYDASGFFGLVGPPGLSPALVEKINTAVARILKESAIRKSLSEQGAEPITSTPAEYAALIREEVGKWGKVVRESGAKID